MSDVMLPFTRTAKTMLYMEHDDARPGHFEACLPESSSPITPAALRTTLLQSPTSDCSADCCRCVHAADACRPNMNGGAAPSPASIPLAQPLPLSRSSPAVASEASFSPERSRSPRARPPCSPTPIATAITQPCICPEQDSPALRLHSCTHHPPSQASAPYASTPLSANLAERMRRQEIPTHDTVPDSLTSQDFEAVASEASFLPERSRSPRARPTCSPTPIATAITQPCICPEQDSPALRLHSCTHHPPSQASAPYASTPLSANLAERMRRQEIPTHDTVPDSLTSQDFEACQDIGSAALPSPTAQMRCAENPCIKAFGPITYVAKCRFACQTVCQLVASRPGA